MTRRPFGIQAKLLASFGVLIATFLFTSVFATKGMDELADNTAYLYEHPFTVATAALSIERDAMAIGQAMRDMRDEGSPEAVRALRDFVARTDRQIDANMGVVRQAFQGPPSMVDEAERRLAKWRAARVRGEVALRAGLSRDEEATLRAAIRAQRGEALETVAGIRSFALARGKAFSIASDAKRNELETNFVIITVLVTTFGLIVTFVMTDLIVRPIKKAVVVANAVASGDLSARAVVLSHDETGRLLQSLNDMSDSLQRMQNQLVHSEKLASLGGVVAGISHELNTPLGVAVTIASTAASRLEALQAEFAGNTLKRSMLKDGLDQLGDSIRLLDRSVRRAAGLVASFKQVAMDQTSERAREFDLRQSIDDLIAMLQPSWKNRPVQVRNDIAPGLVCHSLPGQIGQVVGNLVQNAVLHAFEGRAHGSVVIDCVRQSHGIVLTVRDDGIGMPAETLHRVFEPFYTTKLGQGGSGLGLSIANRIATTILGGSLEVASTPGQGTCFTLAIPLHLSDTLSLPAESIFAKP